MCNQIWVAFMEAFLLIQVGIGGCVAGGIYPDKATFNDIKESFITAIKSGKRTLLTR